MTCLRGQGDPTSTTKKCMYVSSLCWSFMLSEGTDHLLMFFVPLPVTNSSFETVRVAEVVASCTDSPSGLRHLCPQPLSWLPLVELPSGENSCRVKGVLPLHRQPALHHWFWKRIRADTPLFQGWVTLRARAQPGDPHRISGGLWRRRLASTASSTWSRVLHFQSLS